MTNWKLEDDVDNFVSKKLEVLNLERGSLQGFTAQSAFSDRMKQALAGSAKTQNKTNFGKPDFSVEKYAQGSDEQIDIPVVIEDKFGANKLISKSKDSVKFDEQAVRGYAVNGALYYAQNMIASGQYKDVIAIGIAGDNKENIKLEAYYVYGFGDTSFKKMTDLNDEVGKYSTLNFLENTQSFEAFLQDAKITPEEEHRIFIDTREKLHKHANELNKLMHNHDVTAPQRVLYVSGMLLSMQDIKNDRGEIVKGGEGLTPSSLTGITDLQGKRDGEIIAEHIHYYLNSKTPKIPEEKTKLMMSSFYEIQKDPDRDKPITIAKSVSKLIDGLYASVNKQIFTYIYENVFLAIDGTAGHLDIMGEMYSEFLKYALGDGKELGIVLTPPYVTRMMAQILDIDQDSRVIDLATGSAGFLISSMQMMVQDAEKKYGKNTTAANEKIYHIKHNQLMGVEKNAEMFTLAATNMILRGDGSSNIIKGDSFGISGEQYNTFNADRLLLNPPFSHEENGMPFIKHGMAHMKSGYAAIIIQDSAGSGKAVGTNQEMLKYNTLVASIKMPVDLFQPMAGVQTSIYVFKVGEKHNFNVPVKFINFQNDGYKRTGRGLNEVDSPVERYQDIVKIYQSGKTAVNLTDFHNELWDLDEIYVEDQITNSGKDWNFEQHKKINTKPTEEDFMKTVGDYLSWEVSELLKGRDSAADGRADPKA
ncbi:MAG: N-6 DNA methylase [Candidatus Ancillula sp.]|jgi:type I restriction-modification system DNA methylase subunit|nr:N-6 DNA methylase [Candidatus Ancillula sp.]